MTCARVRWNLFLQSPNRGLETYTGVYGAEYGAEKEPPLFSFFRRGKDSGATLARSQRLAEEPAEKPRATTKRGRARHVPVLLFLCLKRVAVEESLFFRVCESGIPTDSVWSLSLSLETWMSASERERGIPKQRVPTRVPQRGIQHVLSRLRMKTNRQVGSGAEGSGRRHRAALERAAESPLENSHRRVVFNMCA